MSQQSQPGTAGLEDSWVAARLLCTVYFGILDGFSSNKQKKFPSMSCDGAAARGRAALLYSGSSCF